MKKLFSILSASLMLITTACATQDNNGNTQSTGEVKYVQAANVYDGYEELQGKDYENLKLPDKIVKPDFEKLYRFCHCVEDIPDSKDITEKFIRKLAGDSYNADYLQGPSEVYSYFYNSPDLSVNMQYGVPLGVARTDEQYEDHEAELLGAYSPSDTSKTIKLDGVDCTLGELLEGMDKCLNNDVMQYHNGLTAFPMNIRNYQNSKGQGYAKIEYGVKFNGIMLEDHSPLFLTNPAAGYEINTFYLPNHISLSAKDKNNYSIMSSTVSGFDTNAEEIKEAMSITYAAQLLKSELAPNVRFEIDSVELRYCAKKTAPTRTADSAENSRILADFGEVENPYFEPTWCFYYFKPEDPNTREAIKVNAITGEITIDNSEGKQY